MPAVFVFREASHPVTDTTIYTDSITAAATATASSSSYGGGGGPHLRSSSTAGGSAVDAAGPDAESLMLTRGILTRFSLDVKSALKLNVSSGPEMPLP